SSFATCQRYCGNARIADDSLNPLGADEQSLERPIGECSAAKDVFDGKSALRDVRRVLQHADLSGHPRGSGKSKDLPKRKIPWHDCEDDSERLESNPTFAALHLHWLISEKSLRVIRVVTARRCALLGFGDCGPDRFSHLQGHQSTQLTTFRIQNSSRLTHAVRAFGEGGAAVPAKRGDAAIERFVDSRSRERLESAKGLSGRRI